ncbi:ion channel protein [Microbacterium candidum]|uniref:Ion channel protein n=1 Tax=Microbacterium candidum TaxID=3041922 RepID=A0ABT7MTE3_9MICO|nr:ion channel protein [Microbacterium sp. ASV49]MDL9977720.1 ion channel protein [Microbacterium sp. ASV49]
MSTPASASPGVRLLILAAIPAVLIGIGSALILKGVYLLSDLLEPVLWQTLPKVFGATESTPWWIFTVLTVTGALIGAVVWLVPGHAGPDSATTELDGPFPKLMALPSLALVLVLSLAGGVSLGPENPILAINAVLAMTLLGRLKRMPPALLSTLAVAGTIGALFGTPVAAALVFTGAVAGSKLPGSLWDKLFLPLAAAAAGSGTTLLLDGPVFSMGMAPVGQVQPYDLLMATVIAMLAAAIGVLMIWVFPFVHRGFHALRNPLLFTLLGGVVLGVLGMIGGPITLFKGAEQTGELLKNAGHYSTGQLAAIAGIKIVALLVAAGAGFRGGRIFPSVFIGTALGMLGAALVPGLPLPLAVACGVMGFVLAVARDGWIALFIAVAVLGTGDVAVLATLCVIILPTWLVVTKAPGMLIKPKEQFAPAGVRAKTS